MDIGWNQSFTNSGSITDYCETIKADKAAKNSSTKNELKSEKIQLLNHLRSTGG